VIYYFVMSFIWIYKLAFRSVTQIYIMY